MEIRAVGGAIGESCETDRVQQEFNLIITVSN